MKELNTSHEAAGRRHAQAPHLGDGDRGDGAHAEDRAPSTDERRERHASLEACAWVTRSAWSYAPNSWSVKNVNVSALADVLACARDRGGGR